METLVSDDITNNHNLSVVISSMIGDLLENYFYRYGFPDKAVVDFSMTIKGIEYRHVIGVNGTSIEIDR